MNTISEGTQSAQRILRHVPLRSGYAVFTGKLVIGSAYVPPPARVNSRDAVKLQAAFLDKRTANPRPLLARVAGAIWRLA